MLAQLQKKRIEVLENKLTNALLIINELIAGLETKDPEVRALIRDVAVSYMETVVQNGKLTLDSSAD